MFGTERDHGSPAATPGELRTKRAVLTRNLDQLLELPARHLKTVEQTLTHIHEFSEAFQIIFFERFDRL